MASLSNCSSALICHRINVLSTPRPGLVPSPPSDPFTEEDLAICQMAAKAFLQSRVPLPETLPRPLLLDVDTDWAVVHLSSDSDLLVGKGAEKTVRYGVDIFSGKAVVVATTIENPEILREFETMQLLARVPKIVHAYALLSLPGVDHLLMEPFSSESLQQRLEDPLNPPLDEGEQWIIVRDCIEAMAEIHKLDVVHRDLKTSSIMLKLSSETGKVTQAAIGDFGLATTLSDTEQMERFSATRWYLSPEGYASLTLVHTDQSIAKQLWVDYSQHRDVWALGVTIFYLYTKEFIKFTNLKQVKINARIKSPNIPPNVQKLLLGMLQVDPKERWTMEQAKQWVESVDKANAS